MRFFIDFDSNGIRGNYHAWFLRACEDNVPDASATLLLADSPGEIQVSNRCFR
jgi:hypothetical protein